MSKLDKLPFETNPKIKTTLVGTDETGTLKFPTYGSLIVGEEIFVSDASRSDTFSRAAQLAARINTEQNIGDLGFSFDIVGTPNWEDFQKAEIDRQLTAEEIGSCVPSMLNL